MRGGSKATLVVMFALTVGLAWGACGDGSSGGTGAGGSTNCTGGPFQVGCEACVEGSCCAQAAACYDDAGCASCASESPPDAGACTADSDAGWGALLACVRTNCASECFPASQCNPVTNDGCIPPSACDLDQDGVYICFTPATSSALCGECSNANGPPCDATLHCLETGVSGVCARYCCDDGDCAGGTCDMTLVPGGVGLCRTGGDAGSPVCDAPSVAPSMGQCAK